MEDEKVSVPQSRKVSASRGSFPRLTLSKALELATTIHELGDGDPVPRLVIFDKLGKSPDSGSSRMLVTTSNAYGLTSGSYKAERLSTTEIGRSLLGVKTESQRLRVSYKILMANDLFSQFYEKYLNRPLPSEVLGVDTLKLLGNMNEADAKVAYAVFTENLREQGFVKEMSGRLSVLPLDLLIPVGEEEHAAEPIEQKLVNDIKSSVDAPPRNLGTQKLAGKSLPQFNFNIQIQLPENGTPETYDAIFKSMSEHLLNYSE